MLRRRKFLVNHEYQLRYILAILIPMVVLALVISSIMYFAIVDIMNKELSGAVTRGIALSVAQGLIMKSIVWVVLLLVIFGFAGIYLSHRVIGPMCRMEEFIRDISKGDLTARMNLRSKDSFKPFSEQLNSFIEKHGKEISEDKEVLSRSLEILRKETPDEELNKVLVMLDSLLSSKKQYKL